MHTSVDKSHACHLVGWIRVIRWGTTDFVAATGLNHGRHIPVTRVDDPRSRRSRTRGRRHLPRKGTITMSANPVRLQAITDVEAYVPPAPSFCADETPGEIFGMNVFSKSVMQKRLPKSVFKSVMATIEKSDVLDPPGGRRRRVGDEGLGAGEGRDALRARVLPADRLHRREARQLLRADRRRHRDGRVRRQDADPGRARRVQLPQRRTAQHLRGPRLHRLGRHQPRLHPGEPQRQHACASRRSSSR